MSSFRTFQIGPNIDRAETADYSSSDHTFAGATQAVHVYGGSTIKNLVCRLNGDTADVTFKIKDDTILPLSITHVRSTSTVDTVVGLWYKRHP